MSQCVPPIPIRPCVLKYLGKTHNLWFRSTLMLEHQAFEKGLSLQIKPKQTTEFYEQESITPPQQEILDSLAELYCLLQEEDMWAGLWQKRCKFPETATAIAYEQHGFFEQAQETYEKAMEKAKKEHERSNASPAIFPEYQLWEDHWIRCSKELNQWEALTEYGQSKGHINPYLVLECAWRVSNWTAMKEALVQPPHSLSHLPGQTIYDATFKCGLCGAVSQMHTDINTQTETLPCFCRIISDGVSSWFFWPSTRSLPMRDL
ncbi:transformation/transcription domain-associated protein-like [Python bivittatus]|uniref:Transformation/transcription domain-associated protein-like n=1 Tax=Python bivittatus TaxID=176946 RepID=A0A9F2WJL6_PYTBI|nr:transformation/transcription domain-associated protein-like [Python bivittatus]